MLSHERIWKAIDALADSHELSPSGLARLAGLDPTAFNPSKRFKPDGRPRWPSTESIAKILDATNLSPHLFFAHVAREPLEDSSLAPIPDDLEVKSLSFPFDIGFLSDDTDECDIEGERPVFLRSLSDVQPRSEAEHWLPLPVIGIENRAVFALTIKGGSLEPLYRDGDMLVICPTPDLKQGDRLLAFTRQGELMACELERKLHGVLMVHHPILARDCTELALDQLHWLVRILWASQ